MSTKERPDKPQPEVIHIDDEEIWEANPSIVDELLNKPEDEILPWEDCPLPSEGAYYGDKIPGGIVQARPMGIYAERILASSRLAEGGKSLDYLFKKCVKLPDGFDPLDLLAGDRIFLLYFLRGITHGQMYEFMTICEDEDCGKTSIHEYDLNNLDGTKMGPNYELGPEPFKVKLPYFTEVMKDKLKGRPFWVEVKLLRGHEMQEMMAKKKPRKPDRNAWKKRKKRSSSPGADARTKLEQLRARAGGAQNVYDDMNVDQTLEKNLNMLIVSVMGDQSKSKIKKLVSMMHARDTATIREFLKENTPGIDTQIDIKCEFCGQESSIELPITESFFRPTES